MSPVRKQALRRRWADLIKRVFELDPLLCPCGGRLRVISFITEPPMIWKIDDTPSTLQDSCFSRPPGTPSSARLHRHHFFPSLAAPSAVLASLPREAPFPLCNSLRSTPGRCRAGARGAGARVSAGSLSGTIATREDAGRSRRPYGRRPYKARPKVSPTGRDILR